jgi:DNA (cytosine-5)-methyltransferase 1
MRYFSVCSGIEAASIAWEPLGWTPVGFAEIEPFPCEVLKRRWPHVKNYGNLENFQSWDIPTGSVDVIVGGPPCQAFSVAGLREGMADPRGNLSLVYFSLVAKLRPKWLVYENVPGLLSARGGQDFSALLSALAELGYGFAYRTLDAANFGLAQRRKRVFIVGCRTGDWRHPTAVLFDGPSSFGNPKAGKKAGEGTAPIAGASVGSPSRINCQPDGISGAVTNKWHKGSGGPAGDEHYNQVVGSSEALPVIADRASFNQGENALYDPFIGHTDTCPTIVAKGPHAVQPPIAFKVRGGGEYTGTKGGEVRPNEKGGTGMLAYEDKTFTIASTQDQFVATPQQVIPINTMAATRPQGADENRQTFGVGQPGDTMYTITAHHHHAVAAVAFQPGNLRLDAGSDPSESEFPTLKSSMGDQSPHVAYAFDTYNQTISNTSQSIRSAASDVDHVGAVFAPPMAVRRLLPEECEALQGFPRNHTRISWRGKPPEQCPDGPRYKAIGNSMATNCMKWIGKRIQLVEDYLNENNLHR